MEERIKNLVAKYNAGSASLAEQNEIEKLLEQGLISLSDLHVLEQMDSFIMNMETPAPSDKLDHQFYQMISQEKKKRQSFSWEKFFSWPELAPRLAFASFVLIIGIAIGYLFRSPAQKNDQIEMLSVQVNDLKEMMMLTLLEKESATERLKAVSLSQEMNQTSKKVTDALLKTLNNDENVNVRLAALDALKMYTRDSQVREDLIRSISHQDSPLVQLALAELMATLQEKSSVKALEKILHDENTPSDVKKKIEESIQVLI